MKARSPYLLFLAFGVFLSGCVAPDGARRFALEVEEYTSVGSYPEYGPYLLAQERLARLAPGMSRGTFFRTMQLRRLPGEEWYTTFSGGDGWLVELSRQNQIGSDLVEEYSFGYREGRRVVERNLVILRNGKIQSILHFPTGERPWGEKVGGQEGTMPVPPERPPLPQDLLTEDLSRREENRLLRDYFKVHFLTPEAFARAKPKLRNLRVGMTAGELRHQMEGILYRLRNGYVYLVEGFLWGPSFVAVQTPTGNLTFMPFGYIKDEKEVQQALVKIVDGIITNIEWKPEVHESRVLSLEIAPVVEDSLEVRNRPLVK